MFHILLLQKIQNQIIYIYQLQYITKQKHVVSWNLSETNDTKLVIEAHFKNSF
ncbi:hypothetical protein ACR82Z_03300 [Mycoplasma sp. 6243]|uniref:hypothetical protein n=1 Tax=Mycoplasma sp. 6243 TaxID=3440865 RepID=UPI003EBA7AFB